MSYVLPTQHAAAAPQPDTFQQLSLAQPPPKVSHSNGNTQIALPNLDSSNNCLDYTPHTILVTGGAGFIGSSVLCHLIKKYPNYHYVCLDKLEYCATTANLSEISNFPNFTFIKGDICSIDLVNHIILSQHVDTIIHFAAQTHVDNSFGLALDFTRTNVYGTHVLLEGCKLFRHQIQRFIHVSTDEVYGESQMHSKDRLDEQSNLNPSNPYAATKVAAEFLIRSYHQSFGIPTIITRGNNVYGPRQYPEKLIPKFIYLLNERRPCPLHGDGSHRRSFLFVDDVCNAFDIILHRGIVGTIYNIGSEQEISNLEVLNLLIDKFQLSSEREKYVQFVRDRPYNDLRYFIDTKSLHALGWRRAVDFDVGLDLTIKWYLTHKLHWGDVGEAILAPHAKVGVKVQAEIE